MPMRVIGGTAGGLTLKGPPRSGVRPTADRVRESIFEILAAHGCGMGSVLDLYSGTGAMGIEALSRGADRCDFVEADSRACEVIRENLTRTRLSDRAKVFPLTVARALARLAGPYDLVVADPPYEYDRAEQDLAAVIEKGLLATEGTLVVEHSKRKQWPETLAGRPQLLTRRYGDTSVTFYR
ncbi:MAG TPA: 16S rRNA (guanine(966)-N(2))-methyltransferase RsmD [Dehalococcoidia bacterium]|nr:16S rRNA (guanine(966)-N(2))-methyltransferase RsmD [Dehalococcoidia bacterium]